MFLNKKIILNICICLSVGLNSHIVLANENMKTEKSNENSNTFIKKYILTEENPVFGKHDSMLGISYGYDIDRYHHNYSNNRHLHIANIHYSVPMRLFNTHGRLTFSFFTLLGRDKAAINPNDGKYHQIGAEIIPEVILGHKNFYVTFGAGLSYLLGLGNTLQYRSNNPTPTNGISKQPGDYDGMTYFNFAINVAIGHRFGDTCNVELFWRHYSNGALGEVNYDVNAFGLSLNYLFSILK